MVYPVVRRSRGSCPFAVRTTHELIAIRTTNGALGLDRVGQRHELRDVEGFGPPAAIQAGPAQRVGKAI